MSDRKRMKSADSRLAIELKAGDQISLERDDKGNPLKFVVASAKLSADGHTVTLTDKSGSHKHVVEWKKEVQFYLPPKKDTRYALLFWLAKHLKAPIRRA